MKEYIHIDDVYRLIAGHSNYHGDDILSALTCIAEGKNVTKPIIPLDDEDCSNKIIYCRDCKYWKDSDGVYRRGVNAESNCPINSKSVYEGNGFCYFAERKDENLKEDKNKKYEEAIEIIKEEIKKNILDEPVENGTNAEMACYNSGLLTSLDIIDKHIKG